jgi:transmembrane sensor
MTTPHSATALPDEVEEQATLWTARLRSGPLPPEQWTELQAWLAQPAHRALLDDYCETSADFDAALAVARAEGTPIITAPATPPASFRRRHWVAGTAAAGIAAALAFVFWPQNIEILATEPGERADFTLADGSSLKLSGNTRAAFSHSRAERRVRLEAGEALFTVNRDPARPFFVETNHGLVRVTGTVFNIRADAPEGEEVTVLEGSVAVSAEANGQSVAMRAGDQAMLYGQDPQVRPLSPEALQQVTAWQEGRIVFTAEPLRSALARVARYHGRKIDISAHLDGLTLGGQYDLADYDTLLEDITRVLPVSVLRAPDGSARVVPR